MNKNQKILAALGGVIALAVAAAGFFAWSAYSGKVAALEGDDEGNDGLDAVQAQASMLSRKPVYPCAESVKAIDANVTSLADWQTRAKGLAERGDRPIPKMTPAQFKTEMVAEAKRLVALPGEVGGALAKADFAFGPFRPYIAEGKMPGSDEMANLQRRWDDVALVVETLAQAGASELVDVAFGADAAANDAKKDAKKGAKKPVKRPALKNKAKAADAAEAKGLKACSYVVTFAARPAALVKAVNALGTHERFIVVDSMTMMRTADPVSDVLGGTDKKKEASARGGRGRGSRRAAADDQKKKGAEETGGGIVTDPATDAPMRVTLKLTVYDFGLLGDASDEDETAAKPVAKAEAKAPAAKPEAKEVAK